MKIKFPLLLTSILITSYCLLGQSSSDSIFLKPTKYIDSDNSKIINKAKELTSICTSDNHKLKAIFEFVRDTHSDTIFESHKASEILELGGNSCHQRSILFAALCRTIGMPARLHWQKAERHDYRFNDGTVKNLVFIHGIVGVKVNNNWHLYEPVGNNAKWHVWVQKNEINTLTYRDEQDCLLQDTDKITFKTLPIYFSDYFVEMEILKEKIDVDEISFITN